MGLDTNLILERLDSGPMRRYKSLINHHSDPKNTVECIIFSASWFAANPKQL